MPPESATEKKVADEQAVPTAVDNKDAKPEDAPSSRPSGTDQIPRLGNIEILPQQRLQHLDQGSLQAYAARQAGSVGSANMFALICEPWLVPRIKTAHTLMSISNPQMARIMNQGIVYWPLQRAERFVFVYENNLGQRLMKECVGKGMGWKNEKVLTSVLKPLVGVLSDLRNNDIVHGRINPMNMYDGGSKSTEKVILGECVAAPASTFQPALFEPLERAMCDPLARGLGNFSDDMYALGVSLTILLRFRDPLEGMTDQEIIHQKLEYGSYVALTGKERFTGAILELLRGLLYDDPYQRWTLDDVMAWLDGQRLSPKQTAKKPKAARSISFNDERYNRASALAMDLEKNLSAAVQLIDGGELEQWVQRSLEDNLVKGRLEQAIDTAHEQGRGAGYAERLVSKVSIALDPDAPLRYKNVHLTPAGFPQAFLDALYHKRDINPYVEIINHQLVLYWLNAQNDMKYDVADTVARFDSCRNFMKQQNIIYGVERCLYFLYPECPCYSEKLKEYYILSPEKMLMAFEEISQKPNRPELFIDRHVASFLSVRDRRVIDPYLADLNAPEMYKRIMGNVKVLASIQARIKSESFPGVCSWITSLLEPCYERIHDRELRLHLKKRIEKIKEAGDIVKLTQLLDSVEMKEADFKGFREAMVLFNKLRNEAASIEDKLSKPEVFVRESGREYAAVIASVIAGIVIIVFCIIFFTQGGIL